jgi:hypothetical protein
MTCTAIRHTGLTNLHGAIPPAAMPITHHADSQTTAWYQTIVLQYVTKCLQCISQNFSVARLSSRSCVALGLLSDGDEMGVLVPDLGVSLLRCQI